MIKETIGWLMMQNNITNIILQSLAYLAGILITGYVALHVIKQQLVDFKESHAKDIKGIKDDLSILRNDFVTSIRSLRELSDVKDKNITDNFKRLEVKQDKHNGIIERTYALEARVTALEKNR